MTAGNTTGTHDPGNFYGNWRTLTKVRWLQQTWWRYLQARWGYSTTSQSWELLNEGDPYDGRHSTLAGEFAKYRHPFKPDDHLATTSNWIDYPASFWLGCPNCDFTDYHRYVFLDQDPNRFNHPALATYDYSNSILSIKRANGIAKPVIRGETGFVEAGNTDNDTHLFEGDIAGTGPNQGQALWLHNFVWGQINAGGMLESYWCENDGG